ncbi:PA14 domain-containing protein [Streptomyces xylophagus]|uniref:PA14 domain-containing protein n=1 Tax=Streptomyces xylophagus TaxID=285514 RepID=UPI0005BAA6A9|nr:PA14 domain-containing protein [Streptomyces xylophagus]
MKTALRATAVVLAGTAGVLTTVAVPSASAATSCTSPVYKRQFFANTTFKGTPRKTDCDSAVDESWSGAPASGLPKDNFGVRWSVTRDFGSGGPFALAVTGLDGIRVYVDGVRKIDLWKNTSTAVGKTVNVTVPKGRHTLRVDYVNWTGAAKAKFTYTPRTSATVDKVKPLTPMDPLMSYDTASNKAKLSWGRNAEMDLAGYRVYRRLRGSTSWTRLTTTTATSYTDTPPATGAVYYYEARAYDKAGNESAGTADQLVTGITLTAPFGLASSVTDTTAELSWRAVPGAVKYRVVRTNRGGADKVTDVNWNHLSDDTLDRVSTYAYKVAAVDGSGHLSPYTDTVSAHRPPAAPRDLTATADIGAALLSWTVRPEDAWVYTFHVYRSTTLPVDTSGTPVTCTTTYKELADGSRRYSCGDYSADEDTTYHYAVTTQDQVAAVSLPSATVTVTTLASDKAPAPVTGLTATATEYGIELDWADNTEPDLARYAVYRGTVLGEEGDEQVCSMSEWAWLSPSTSRYTDVTLPDGQHRCYFVAAVDTAGNSTRWSSSPVYAVSIDELDLTPSVATPEDSPISLSATATDSGVGLAWNAVDSATGYQVYRWNPVTKAYEKLAATTDRSYDDTTAARGTTHHYWVTALYADGTESAPGADWAILEP